MRFADQLTDIGITYDYEPSDSPGQLADWVDVVAVGKLTSGFDTHESQVEPPSRRHWLGYEMQVTETVHGEVDAGAVIPVWMEYSASQEASVYEQAIAEGAPVVVFGNEHEAVPEEGLVPYVMEGFMTACEDQAPIGWVGTQDDWESVATLEDVAEAARDRQ